MAVKRILLKKTLEQINLQLSPPPALLNKKKREKERGKKTGQANAEQSSTSSSFSR